MRHKIFFIFGLVHVKTNKISVCITCNINETEKKDKENFLLQILFHPLLSFLEDYQITEKMKLTYNQIQ